MSAEQAAGLNRDGAASDAAVHAALFGVRIAFCPAQHRSIVRGSRDFGRGHFTGAQVQHQAAESKMKKRGLTDDTCSPVLG